MACTRREVLVGLTAASFEAMTIPLLHGTGAKLGKQSDKPTSSATWPFRVTVINDEITQDFEQACKIVSQEFGLQWIELRTLWDKNITVLSPKEIEDARKILDMHKLQVTDIASPLFKTDWPGAPISEQSERRDQFHADFDAKAQDKLLQKCIALARTFNTNRIRCFDYWRLADQKPYRAAINAKLQDAARQCAKEKMILLLENEMSCNTGTGEESAAVLKAVPNSNFMLNWDPGNAAALGSTPYPDGYDALPKNRIGHCHVKDVIHKPDGKYEWAAVGMGTIDWVGQFKALLRNGYHLALSLETHWRGAGSPEASTRASMEGLRKSLAKAGVTW
jgi:sugar phosphate isomerase/epimerase